MVGKDLKSSIAEEMKIALNKKAVESAINLSKGGGGGY